MSVQSRVQRLRTLWSELGPLGLLDRLLKRPFPSGNPWLSWDRRVLLEQQVTPTTPLSSTQVRALSETEALHLVGENSLTHATIVAALRRGETCWRLDDADSLVAYAWVGSPDIISSDTGFRFVVPTGRHYFWRDVYVCPQFRGQRRIEQLFQWWAASVVGEGAGLRSAVWIFTEIDPSNVPSLRAHHRLGFVDVGSLTMFCVLGVRIYSFRSSHGHRFSCRFLPRNLYLAQPRQ